MAGQAALDHLVIAVAGRGHQRHAGQRESVHRGQQVVADQRNVLNAFAVELEQKLLNLAAALLRFFVQRNAYLAVGRGHGARRQAGVFALNIEVANLAEIEQLFIKPAPERHAAPVHVVRQVVNQRQAVAHRVAVYAVQKNKINVVDRLAFFKAVNQVQRRAADALDGGQVQLHRAGLDFNRLRAEFECALVGQMRILHPKRHAAGAGAVFGGKVAGDAFGFAVDDEIDGTLAVQQHVLGTVAGDQRKAHALEHRLQQAGGGRGELDEFKAHQAHRVVKQVGHGVPCEIWHGRACRLQHTLDA